MFSVRETPWHGIGDVLEEPPATVAEAIEASGLGWSVAKEPIVVDRGDKSTADWWVPRCEEIPGFATVRQDTREVLGIVGERYRLVQNHEAFTFIDQLLGSAIHFETAGSLHGGHRVWVLATLPHHVEVGGDDVRPYVLLMNSHDGSTTVVAATTPIRVVTPSTGVCPTRGRSSRSGTPKRSCSASTRLAACSTYPSTTTSSSSASATSSPPSATPSASSARFSMSSIRAAPAIP